MNEDPDYLAGFNAEFEELGEDAVRRHVSSGNYSPGKREMAENWLDLKQREAALARARAAQRAENRANMAIAISIIAIVASLIGR
nr:hypothetical protein [uncultured Rhodopila sp.]